MQQDLSSLEKIIPSVIESLKKPDFKFIDSKDVILPKGFNPENDLVDRIAEILKEIHPLRLTDFFPPQDTLKHPMVPNRHRTILKLLEYQQAMQFILLHRRFMRLLWLNPYIADPSTYYDRDFSLPMSRMMLPAIPRADLIYFSTDNNIIICEICDKLTLPELSELFTKSLLYAALHPLNKYPIFLALIFAVPISSTLAAAKHLYDSGFFPDILLFCTNTRSSTNLSEVTL